jgi:hypothetical protein
MKRKTIILTLICAAILTACGDGATKKLVKHLNSSYDYDGREVELSGYIFTFHGAMARGDVMRFLLQNNYKTV